MDDDTISSSIYELGLHKDYYPHIDYVDSFYADTKLLKDIIYKYNIHYNFLNLDIQGAELNALKGMENYLHKVEYIYTEVNCDYVYKDCPLIDEIDEYLKKFGFDRVETIWQAGCKWGDALYINRRYTTVTLFGTCRFDKIDYNTNLNNFIGYTHNTKEVLQLIRFLKGEIAIPPPYNTLCFKTAIEKRIGIDMDNHHYKHKFNNTKIFVIEICSRKKYIHNNYFLHHICVDKRMTHFNNNTPKDILDSYTVETQSDEEIENDIVEIQKILYPRKVVIVSHYNSKINGEYIESRNGLVCLLDKICEKHGISFVNPREALGQYTQEQVMYDNLSDYTEFGLCEFGKYMNNYINTLL